MVDLEEEIPRTEYVIDDLANPNNVLYLTEKCPTLNEAIKRTILESPDLMVQDYEYHKQQNQTVTTMRIRMSFWHEYETAVVRGANMRMSQIIGGVCTETYFRAKVLTDNKKMAFILCPPTDYVVQVKEALSAGMENLRKIVSAKVVDDDGYLMPKAADMVIKAVQMLDLRIKGAIVQRIDQRSVNLNMNQNSQNNQIPMPRTVEEIRAQLAEVKKQLAASAPDVEDQIIEVKKLSTGGGSYVPET